MRKEPHGSVGLGSLSLQEFSQQPLHLPVSGVCTFHRLLCVKTVKRTQYSLHDTGWQYKALLIFEVKGKKGRILICCMRKHKNGKNNDSAIMWSTTKTSVRCSKASANLCTKESHRKDAMR